MMYLRLLAPILVLLAATPALAGDVSGTVSDGEALPVAGLVVSVPELDLHTRTDIEGAFHFSALPEGTFELSVRLKDGGLHHTSITVPARGIAKRNIFLLSSRSVAAAQGHISREDTANAARMAHEAMEAAQALLRDAEGSGGGEFLTGAPRG